MKDTEAIALLKKYKAGNATEEERARLESWYLAWNDEDQSFEEEELVALRKEMWAVMPKAKPVTKTLWPRVAVAAAAVAAITLGVWFYNISNTPSRTEFGTGSPLANDIAPGKNTATLTLANGKTINLSDAKTGVVIDASRITYSDNTVISSADPSSRPEGRDLSSGGKDPSLRVGMTSVATPRGGQYQVVLPDGTKVWLNADSKLEFPSSFVNSKTRFVKLSGEGYFEVAKDKTHPFIVATDKQEVEVLGTHFNINSYTDESAIRTTLLEGSVSVRHAESNPEFSSGSASRTGKTAIPDGEAVILKPSQQSVVTGSNQIIKVNQVDAGAFVDWKNGEFIFEGETLESIMRKVARWYDIEVTYAANAPKDFTLSGVVSRKRNISAVLERMESTGKMNFKIEGKKVTVMGIRK